MLRLSCCVITKRMTLILAFVLKDLLTGCICFEDLYLHNSIDFIKHCNNNRVRVLVNKLAKQLC